jgi:hypothetical protein
LEGQVLADTIAVLDRWQTYFAIIYLNENNMHYDDVHLQQITGEVTKGNMVPSADIDAGVKCSN